MIKVGQTGWTKTLTIRQSSAYLFETNTFPRSLDGEA